MDLIQTCSADFCSVKNNHDLTSLLPGVSSSAAFKLSSVFLFLIGFQEESSAVITNVSVIQSWRWFFHLSAFESVFLAFMIAQVAALNILGILPINITEFWQGNPAGRRKRRGVTPRPPTVPNLSLNEIGNKLLILYKRLDNNKCGFRALCELQSKVTCGDYNKQQLPRATQLVLTTFLSYAKNATATGKSSKKDDEEMRVGGVDINTAVEPYAEAVLIGSQAHSFQSDLYKNGTRLYENVCHKKYPDCPVTSDEVMEYIEKINLLDY